MLTARPLIFLLLCGLLGGCAGFEQVAPPDDDDQYVLACGKSAGASSCETQARAACPAGFEMLSNEQDFERHEWRIRCNNAGDTPP